MLWRPGDDGVHVCLVHRPRYDDWSLPKGKLDAGEHPLAAAVREVREETGHAGVPRLRLPSTAYRLPDGADKLVDYWAMRACDEPPGPRDDEADEVVWLSVGAAVDRLSYDHDRRVLDAFAATPATVSIALVRHARAGKRDTWAGPDDARPLDATGSAQADALAPLLALLRPGRLLAATPRRCVQTLMPLAAAVDLPIEADSAFAEPAPGQRRAERAAVAARRLAELAAAGGQVVVCSQGKVIPGALADLAGSADRDSFTTPKGTGWLLSFDGDRLTGLDRLAAEL
ncbi:NUDIX hydrolase [Spirilliplanes yamanashiensis]|uniref:NUDIX hydrolase n=1 Tax=Spirilliplanes yamanashiensis TaxID=42233 RepID=A0A8J3Y4R6_9ACTN|nr:8-oxo-dGTP diphosphatase [Spirilliplanes yamanashiensis]GIJ01412.1 NUDIX hydrolase [Spirilliplanes yamanashiensis]